MARSFQLCEPGGSGPARHPLRLIRKIVNAALARLDGAFAGLYAAEGRPMIAPERLLRAELIQACPREGGDSVFGSIGAPADGADA
jgi:hypothetical protein